MNLRENFGSTHRDFVDLQLECQTYDSLQISTSSLSPTYRIKFQDIRSLREGKGPENSVENTVQ